MKVLQINSVCGIGSTGRIATDIHKLLTESKSESYIAYGKGEAVGCNNSIRIGNKLNIYMHGLRTRLFDDHGFGSKKSTQNFLKSIEKLEPDIIHLHNIHGYYINIKELFTFLKKSNKPVFWTLHDCWPFTGHCAYFDYVNCQKWKEKCFECPQSKEYPTSLIFDNSTNNHKNKKEIFTGVKNLTIVTPSEWLAGLVRESFLNEYPVRVINNGINLDVFKPTESTFRQKYELNNKFIILGVASVWDKRKGYKYFIELSNRLDENERIILVGLTQQQIELLPNNIIGISRTNNIKELAEVYTAADVFINPTLEDNFPTTNIEALACGTPVITFNTGGSIEAIDEKTGYIVEKGNVEDLLDRIRKVKANQKSSYSLECRSRAIKMYEKEERFHEYIDMYIKAIDNVITK